jgi:hypothetical protein
VLVGGGEGVEESGELKVLGGDRVEGGRSGNIVKDM